MLDIPNLMFKQIEQLINEKNILHNYISNGFKFELERKTCKLIITYRNKEYIVSIIKENDQYYWQLIPYNKASFITNIDNGLEIVLFAIKENEELYIKHENKNLQEE